MTAIHKISKENNPKNSIKQSKTIKKKLVINQNNRIDLRLNSELKNLFLKAATLSGNQNLTNYIVSTVRERSIQLIEEYERLVLSNADWQFVVSLLDKPSKPNAALRKAAKLHQQLGLE